MKRLNRKLKYPVKVSTEISNRLWLLCFLFFTGMVIPVLGETVADMTVEKSLSAFPILMYDTDIGVGYGGKAKFVNYLKRKESFDFILFNSTKGERWYVFTFAIPDFEVRQGKTYAFSLDIRAEYDKYLKYYFYGLGSNSEKADQTEFTFEKTELSVTLGRGFSPHFVLEAGYILKNVRYYKIEENRPFTTALKAVGDQFSPLAFLVIRYDTSDSQIHPRRGLRFLLQNEAAARVLSNTRAKFHRFTLDGRKYQALFGENDILAFRLLLQKISGPEIPLFELPVLGGGSVLTALRGYVQNRFLDRGKWLVNVEYRFPLWKKLGGNVFADAGSLWPRWEEMLSSRVVFDAGGGLRYYLENFVVRFDMGFSHEGTGVYFNFGHVF